MKSQRTNGSTRRRGAALFSIKVQWPPLVSLGVGLIDKRKNINMTKSTLKNIFVLGEGFTTEFERSGTLNLGREYGVGVAEPIIEASEHWFTVTFPRPNVESESENGSKTSLEVQVTPEVTPQVTPQVESMLSVFDGEMTRSDIMRALGLTDRKHFRAHYQQAAVRFGLIEMTIPDKPSSRNQKYRLTARGVALLNSLKGG